MVSSPAPLCRRCGRAVEVNRDHYETFEQMHWVCFHYEFEHGDGDPDRACRDSSCPARAFDPAPPTPWGHGGEAPADD